MTGRIFIDSNVWIYLFAKEDNEKNSIARKFISEKSRDNNLIISFQVINEVCRILKKKDFTEEKLKFVIDNLAEICEVHQSTIALSFKASELRENHNFSFWDSHIVAHAIDAECNFLISEDMQNNCNISGTIIKNIFSEVRC
jgi:predicted nucleic acid-binding protein